MGRLRPGGPRIAAAAKALALAALVAAAWPAIRACASPAFRAAFPHRTRQLAALLALTAAAAAAAAAVLPTALLAGGSAAAATVVALAWRGRPGYGRRRRLPPGRLRPLPLGRWFEDAFFLEQAARHGPVFKTTDFARRPMACVVGLRSCNELTRAAGDGLGPVPMPFNRFVPGGYLRYVGPDRHAAYRALFRHALSHRVVDAKASLVASDLAAGLAAMAGASAAAGSAGVPPRPHLERMLLAAWLRLFLGIEPGSDDFRHAAALNEAIEIAPARPPRDGEVHRAVAELTALARRLVGEGAGPSFLDAIARSRPGALDDPALAGNLVFLMHASWRDTSGLLQWLARMLTDHPQWVERLRLAPEEGERSGAQLATRIVLETLRLEQSEFRYRVAARDLEHEGFVIPRGWRVRLCVRESHRDPHVFERPFDFDPDRFLERRYTRDEYAPFGFGNRSCLGEGLVRSVGGAFVRELALRYDWRTVADGPREHSRHGHWRPSSRWRVVVAEVEPDPPPGAIIAGPRSRGSRREP